MRKGEDEKMRRWEKGKRGDREKMRKREKEKKRKGECNSPIAGYMTLPSPPFVGRWKVKRK